MKNLSFQTEILFFIWNKEKSSEKQISKNQKNSKDEENQ